MTTTARVEIQENGDWLLTVEGTGIRRVLWNEGDHDFYGNFPGGAMGHRLIEEGYQPDRSAAEADRYDSLADKLAATTLAGWQPQHTDHGRGAWTIPCVPTR